MADGIPSSKTNYNCSMPLLPQDNLLLEHFYPKDDDIVLLLEGGDGSLAEQIAKFIPDGEVLSLSRDLREIWSAQNGLKDSKNASSAARAIPESHGWDWVVLTIPKGRRYTRSLLLTAWQSLVTGGKLLLSGPTRKGAKAVIKDAERLFGNAFVLGYRNHHRVAVSEKLDSLPEPLPDAFQSIGIAPGTSRFIELTLPQKTLTFETHPGIFSWKAVDEGTCFLIENLEINNNETVWDVGCGYGILGLSAAVKGASLVLMTDVNLIAIDYAVKNIIRNHLDDRVIAVPSIGLDHPSVLSSSPRYDLVISNPAFHQGRDIDKSMTENLFSTAPAVLKPHGRMVIVSNRFLNYKKDLIKYFQTVTTIAENRKYHVIQAHNDYKK